MNDECSCSRRAAVATLATTGMALLGGARAFAQSDPKSMRPQPGDVLVYADGASANKPIVATDLAPGSKQILAWPMDPSANVVRDGSKLNSVLVIAVDPSKMSDTTKANAAGGIVAYSAVCTHVGCLVEGFEKDSERLLCPCHQSEYDPADGANVVGGPAPSRLAALPLKAGDGGTLAVAGLFKGHVGLGPTS